MFDAACPQIRGIMNGNDIEATSHGLSTQNCNYLKCWFTLIHYGKDVFTTIFEWGFRKPNDEIKNAVLQTLNNNNSKYRSTFDGSQRSKIEDGNVDHFDITLVYLLLQRICNLPGPADPNWGRNGDPDTLPNILYQIKMLRNDLAHGNLKIGENVMIDELNNMKELFGKALMKAGDKFNVPIVSVEQIKDKISGQIEYLQQADVSVLDQLKNVANEKAAFAKEEARSELRKHYEIISKVMLASRTSVNALKKVEDVFTEPILKQTKNEVLFQQLNEDQSYLDFTRILISKLTDGSLPHLILLLSRSGMGKTTLVKFIMHSWKEQDPVIKGIDDVDLVLYMDCRTSNSTSFDEFLTFLMPNTARIFGISELKLYVASMNILLILDNIDEMQPQIVSTCEELFNFQNFRIVATSKQDLTRFLSRPYHQKHLKLHVQGIADQNIEPYVAKMYSCINTDTNDSCSEDKISLFCSEYFTKSKFFANDCIHSPEIVSHIFFNWMTHQKKPSPDSFATKTAIFLASNELTLIKLYEKVSDIGIQSNILESSLLLSRLNKVFEKIYKTAYETLLQNTYVLPIDLYEQLIEDISILELPTSLILNEIFYIQGSEIGDLLTPVYLTFPSRSFHIFYAAYYVANILIKDTSNLPIAILLGKELFQTSSTNNIVTFFKLLLGHLAHKDAGVLEKYMPEIISEMLTKCSGEISTHSWISLVTETQCHLETIKHIRHLMGNNWSVEDHDISSTFATMLKAYPPEHLSLTTCMSPKKIAHLIKALEISSTCCGMSLSLHFYYNFWVNKNDHCDEFLEYFTHSKVHLESFAGKLSYKGILKVPSSLRRLALHIGPEDVTILNSSLERLKHLKLLYLNLDINNVYPAHGVPRLKLPKSDIVLYVDLWNIHEGVLGWSCDVLASLSPAYCRITLRKTTFDFQTAKMWLKGIRNSRIHSDAFVISSYKVINEIEKRELKNLAESFECLDFKWIEL